MTYRCDFVAPEEKGKAKVKCTLLQALRLCTGRTAHRGSRGIALLFQDHGRQKWVRGQRHAPAALYPREKPGTHCTGGWVGPRAGLDRRGKSAPPTGIRSPDCPARSQSLYRLSYPAHRSKRGPSNRSHNPICVAPRTDCDII